MDGICRLNTTRIVRSLGQGTYGRVDLVETPEGRQYAAKHQQYTENFEDGIKQATLIELDTLTRLRAIPYFVNLEDVCYRGNEVIMYLESMNYSLRDFIQLVPQETRFRYLPKLMNDYFVGAAILQQLNINHYDINTRNILVHWEATQQSDIPKFKMADFGLARGTYCGLPTQKEIVTIPYRSPELLICRNRTTFPEAKIDVWSFGVVIYEYLTGEHLYADYANPLGILREMYLQLGSPPNFLTLLQEGTFHRTYPIRDILSRKISLNKIDSNTLTILEQMFQMDPNDRPGPEQLVQTLGYPSEILRHIENETRKIRPTEPPRKVGPCIPSIIRKAEPGDSYVAIIIAIEILTRYYGLIGNAPLCDNTFSAAAYHLGSTFIDDPPIRLSAAGEKFGLRGRRYLEQIDFIERQILVKIGYVVYNANLTERLKILYNRTGGNRDAIFRYLKSLPGDYFTRPVTSWF
jgi:serine/threonine protein kinase